VRDPEDRPDTGTPSTDEWEEAGFTMGEWMDADLDLEYDTENPESCESCT